MGQMEDWLLMEVVFSTGGQKHCQHSWWWNGLWGHTKISVRRQAEIGKVSTDIGQGFTT